MEFSVTPGVLLGLIGSEWLVNMEDGSELLAALDTVNFSVFVRISSLELRDSSTVQLRWSNNGTTLEFRLSFREENLGVKRFLSKLALGERGSMMGSLGMMGLCLEAG